MKGFVLGLALKQRRNATWKSPLNSKNSPIKLWEKIQSTCKQILEVRKQFSCREIENSDLTSKKLADETRVLTTTSKVAFWRPWLQSKNVLICAIVRNLSQRLPLAVRDLTNVRCLALYYHDGSCCQSGLDTFLVWFRWHYTKHLFSVNLFSVLLSHAGSRCALSSSYACSAGTNRHWANEGKVSVQQVCGSLTSSTQQWLYTAFAFVIITCLH